MRFSQFFIQWIWLLPHYALWFALLCTVSISIFTLVWFVIMTIYSFIKSDLLDFMWRRLQNSIEDHFGAKVNHEDEKTLCILWFYLIWLFLFFVFRIRIFGYDVFSFALKLISVQKRFNLIFSWTLRWHNARI